VERATLEELDLAPQSIDAAIVWHVLEHLRDPAAALERIRRWVRPGGRVIVACPNLASLQARVGGDRWFQQDVPRHLTHFTSRGLGRLMDRSGFPLERMSHVVVEQNPLGMWQTILNRITRGRDVAFRALKRDIQPAPGLGADLAVTAIAGPVVVPVAIALELAAGIAGRGGSVVAVGRREGPSGP
jgi:SAM-dependent methyltransferase